MPQHANCKGLNLCRCVSNCHLLQQALGPCDSDFCFTWGKGLYFISFVTLWEIFIEIESSYLEAGDKT